MSARIIEDVNKVLAVTDVQEKMELCGMETGALNRPDKRNTKRFLADFMLQLTSDEWEGLKCQIGISSSPVNASVHVGRRAIPYTFTEQGVAMLSSVLRYQRAVRSIFNRRGQ